MIQNVLIDLNNNRKQALPIVTKCIPDRKVASFRMKIKDFFEEGLL